MQLRPARDRVPVRRGGAHLRQPRRLQDRRQGDRRPARPVAHLHGQVRRARGQLLPHPPVAARRRTARSSSPTTSATAGAASCSSSSWRACSRRCASFTLLYAPNINSYKRFAAGSFAPTAVAWGHGQPDLRRCGSSATAPALRLENRLPGGDVNPYLALAAMLAGGPARHRARSWSWSRRSRATPTRPTAARCPATLRAARPVRAAPRGARRPSATRSSTTTSTPPTSSWRRSTPPSPTGSAADSSGCEHDGARHATRSSTRRPRRSSRPSTSRPRGDRRGDRAAPRGVPAWRAVAPADRGRLLRRFADAVDEHLEELAALEVANSGHTIGNARWEAGNVATCCATSRPRPSGSSAGRSRSPAASTSRSRSRWASSG